jgi:hypothetical protein
MDKPENYYEDYTWGDVYERDDHYSWQAIVSLPNEENFTRVVGALLQSEIDIDASFRHFDGSVTIETFVYVHMRNKDQCRDRVAAVVEPLGGKVSMRGVA